MTSKEWIENEYYWEIKKYLEQPDKDSLMDLLEYLYNEGTFKEKLITEKGVRVNKLKGYTVTLTRGGSPSLGFNEWTATVTDLDTGYSGHSYVAESPQQALAELAVYWAREGGY